MGVLLVEHPGDQMAIGSQHEPAQLSADRHVAHTGGDKNFLKGFPHPLADDRDIVGGLFRAVRYAYAPRQIDEGNVTAGFLFQFYGGAEEDCGQGGVVLIGNGVGGQKSVDAEFLRAQFLQAAKRLGHLGAGEAVLGVARVVHNLESLFALAQGKGAAGIIPAGYFFGNHTNGIPKEVDVGDIIQVDGSPKLGGQGKFLCGGVVGREHDLSAGKAAPLAHHQFGEGRTVHAAALFPQDF